MKRIALTALTVTISAYGATASDSSPAPSGTENPFGSSDFINIIANTPGVTPTSGIGGARPGAAAETIPETPAVPDATGSAGPEANPVAPTGAPIPTAGPSPTASGAATPPGTSVVSATDVAGTTFLARAYQDGLAEVTLGQLAATRAASKDVRDFAQAMVSHHTFINGELLKIAQAKNAALPTTITSHQSAEVNQLSSLTGAEFDRVYLQQNAAAHRTALASAMHMSADASDEDVRLAANVIAPALKVHLIDATDLLNRLDPAMFVLTLHQGNIAEIEWAQVALRRTTDLHVRQFAEQIITAHTEASQRIRTVAEQAQIVLPSEASADQRAMTDALSRFEGVDFDRAYMEANVTAHAEALRYARAQMQVVGQDNDMRQLAGSLEPDLDSDLRNATALARQVEPSFYYRAYQANLSALRLAYLAMAKSNDSQVLGYAQRMIAEHTPVLLQLRRLAEDLNNAFPADVRYLAGTPMVTLPIEMAPDELLAYSTLLTASATTFDSTYLAYTDLQQEKTIERFNEEVRSPTNAQTQSFAQTLLPALLAHREEAKSLLSRFSNQVLQSPGLMELMRAVTP